MKKNDLTFEVYGKIVGHDWSFLSWKGSLEATCDASHWQTFHEKYSYSSKPWHKQIESFEDILLDITNAPDFQWCRVYDMTVEVTFPRANGHKVRYFSPDPDGEYAEYFYHGDFVPELPEDY